MKIPRVESQCHSQLNFNQKKISAIKKIDAFNIALNANDEQSLAQIERYIPKKVKYYGGSFTASRRQY
jgi:hypothetical protein